MLVQYKLEVFCMTQYRAGWSLGSVQSRYVFEGAGGDQFVGRAATGLSTNDPDFAILPPHFNTTKGPVISV